MFKHNAAQYEAPERSSKRCFLHLWNELKHGVGEQRPNGQANKVRQHFGEVGLFGEGDEQEAEQGRQVDQGDRQKPITPHCRAQMYTVHDS